MKKKIIKSVQGDNQPDNTVASETSAAPVQNEPKKVKKPKKITSPNPVSDSNNGKVIANEPKTELAISPSPNKPETSPSPSPSPLILS